MAYRKGTHTFDCIKNGITEKDVFWSDEFGKHLATDSDDFIGITTSQIRKFFGELRSIEAQSFQKFTLSEVLLLKPKLAYAVGRDKTKRVKSKIGDFYLELSSAIKEIENVEHFGNFVKLVEAVVAYHKYHGGKD